MTIFLLMYHYKKEKRKRKHRNTQLTYWIASCRINKQLPHIRFLWEAGTDVENGLLPNDGSQCSRSHGELSTYFRSVHRYTPVNDVSGIPYRPNPQTHN